MVKLNLVVNGFGIALLLLAGALSLLDIKVRSEKYGWKYEQKTTINGEVQVETINLKDNLMSSILMILFAVSFGVTAIRLMPYNPLPQHRDNYGITFVSDTRPEDWFIDILRPEKMVHIGLGEYEVSIPFDFILSHMEMKANG